MKERPNYREMIQQEFEGLKKDRPTFSLRAFAGKLGISPSFLSMLLAGKRHLSEDLAHQLVTRLDWDAGKSKLFVTLVRYEQARTVEAKNRIAVEIDNLLTNTNYSQLTQDVFNAISKWYHNAILELTTLDSFKSSPEWIAQRLCISQIECELALDRLLRLGLLENHSGKLVSIDLYRSFGEIPSQAIRRYHQKMLSMASTAVDQQSMEERDFSGVTLAADPKKIAKAKIMIKDFRRSLTNFLNEGDKTTVYHLATQLFRLDRD